MLAQPSVNHILGVGKGSTQAEGNLQSQFTPASSLGGRPQDSLFAFTTTQFSPTGTGRENKKLGISSWCFLSIRKLRGFSYLGTFILFLRL